MFSFVVLVFIKMLQSLLKGNESYMFTLQDWLQSAPDVKLHLPASNIFIPTDLSLKGACEKV